MRTWGWTRAVLQLDRFSRSPCGNIVWGADRLQDARLTHAVAGLPCNETRDTHFSRRPMMEYHTLGSSDLHISEISLGSWLTYSG